MKWIGKTVQEQKAIATNYMGVLLYLTGFPQHVDLEPLHTCYPANIRTGGAGPDPHVCSAASAGDAAMMGVRDHPADCHGHFPGHGIFFDSVEAGKRRLVQ